MTTTLHILNATGELNSFTNKIESTFAQSISTIKNLIPVENVDVIVASDAKSALPETGICGYAPSANRVFISIDPDNKQLIKNFETLFLSMLGHELHHCCRWKNPGYGSTLREALVSEGLACHFEAELTGNIPFYAQAISTAAVNEALIRATQELDLAEYNHHAWFFGAGAQPRHTGYTLGFHIVSQHISETNVKASKLFGEPAQTFYKNQYYK